MRRWCSVLLLASASLGAQGIEPTAVDLPSREMALAWLRQDPAVREAAAELVGAGHVAGQLRASPYEWVVTATGQQRRYDTGPRSNEWSAQLERTIRLPGKRTMDRELGDAEMALAKARLGVAVHEAARSLLDLWMDWLQAEHARRLMDDQARSSQASLEAVQTRLRAGDASRLEVNVAAGELSELRQRVAVAETEASKAAARLRIRFPETPASMPTLSEPQAIEGSLGHWRDRVLAASDPLRLAELELQRAQQQATRTRADRLPDPTVGLFSASEAFGRERIVGVSVSVPLPGSYRRERLGQALSAVDAAGAARDRQRRLQEIAVAEAFTDASGNYARWQLARTGAERAADTARLTQRAYSLGEADMQTLLLARRQSLEAARTALDARVTALRARYRLWIDAHRIWGLQQE